MFLVFFINSAACKSIATWPKQKRGRLVRDGYSAFPAWEVVVGFLNPAFHISIYSIFGLGYSLFGHAVLFGFKVTLYRDSDVVFTPGLMHHERNIWAFWQPHGAIDFNSMLRGVC
jgi:hypothetical protein